MVYTGRGSTFKVLFPAVETAAEQPESPADPPPIWQGSGTVLVVDDETAVRDLAKEIFESSGFKVLTANDGRQGVQTFRTHADEIAAVLLDLTMPHMDGEEAFREMRRIRADIRVILSSGYNEQDATHRFAGKGLAGFIQKPYRVDELITSLRKVLEA